MDVFRTSPYPDLFVDSTNPADGTELEDLLQRALENAITAAEDKRGQTRGTFPIRFTIADVNHGNPFPAAHYTGDLTDFIASEVKLAAMYAAFELRGMVRRFADQVGATSQDQLFTELQNQIDPDIISKGPQMTQGEDKHGKLVPITDEHRVPHYKQVFTAKPQATGGLLVNFSPSFQRSLEEMIVPSHNDAAGQCIRGIGYSFLNGALAAGKFFDGGGIWLAADFVGVYPKVRQVNSANDGGSGQAGSTRQMARLMALVSSGGFSSGTNVIDPNEEMNGFLGRAVHGLKPWANLGGIAIEKFVLNKVGVAQLGRGPSGPSVYSEVSVLKNLTANNQVYVVAWQNLQTDGSGHKWVAYDYTDIAAVIKDTIDNYE